MRYFLSDIARICGGELVGEDLLVTSVVTDSRTSVFAAEALFVAMCGKNHDSHDYVPEMLQRGVQAFMVERDNTAWLAEGVGYVRVNNSIEALQQLAAAHRRSFIGRVVGITGSNGKTIVKEWIARSLPADTKLFTSPMSYNSQLGVALSLLMIEGDEDVAIIEAGISEVGEMQRLESMIQPDTVVFTSIGDAHQSNFSSLEEKIREKLILARNATCLIYHSHYSELQPVINQVVSPNCRVVDAADAQCDTLSQNDVIAIDSQLVKTLCREVGYECQNVEYRDAFGSQGGYCRLEDYQRLV